MDEQQRKAQLRKVFDTVAEGYGGDGMAFFHNAAAHLPRVFQLHGHEHLLDVATGTGIAATTLAPHLPHGKVTGIDFSEGMLAQARGRAQRLGLDNLELHFMDMQNIGFDDACFDAANCSFGLFFLPDMHGLLQHIASKVKPGGQVVVTSFCEGAFAPNVDLFLERIQRYGVTPPDFTWKKVCTEAQFHALFDAAGLRDVQVQRQQIGYPLTDAETWWRVIWYAGFRGLVAQLSEPDLVRFRHEHLAEIAALHDGQGIPLDIPALFASGRVA